jgi:hypothetical protein
MHASAGVNAIASAVARRLGAPQMHASAGMDALASAVAHQLGWRSQASANVNALASMVAHRLTMASRATRPMSEAIASALVAELGAETRASRRQVASRLASLLAPRLGHPEARSMSALTKALQGVIGARSELPAHDEKLGGTPGTPKP